MLEGDVVDAVRELKASDGGNINVVGSSDLTQTLMRHGLVDEYRLTIHPVIIGTGKRLFADGAIPTALEPVSVSTTKDRATAHRAPAPHGPTSPSPRNDPRCASTHSQVLTIAPIRFGGG